jgi:hypothetical protein
VLRLPAASEEFRQLQRWLWYEQIEPFGELRDDWRTAKLEAMIHNVNVKSEDQKGPDEFLLRFQPKEATRQTVSEQIMILNILAAAQAAAKADS